MDWDSVARALNGPELVKLVIASILIVAFVFWQRKEAEGVMRGYIVVAAFALGRDLIYLFYPDAEFYRASDLLLVTLLALVFALPLGGGPLLNNALAFSAFFGVLAGALGFFHIRAIPGAVLTVAGLSPALILFFYGIRKGGGGESQARRLVRKVRLPLAFGTLAYLVAEIVLGPGDFYFQSVAVSAYYAVIALVGFFFIDILREELVNAVEYYEESVDSLYDLFTATGSVIKSGFSLQEVLDGMISVAIERTGADGGIVLLTEEFEDSLSVRALQGRFPPPWKLPESLPKDEERVVAHIRHARFKVGEGLFGEMARDGSPLFIPVADDDERVLRQGDEEWLHLRSLIAAPLVSRDQVIGIVAVARGGDTPFSERDFDRLKLLASFGAISVSDAFTFLEAAERGDIDREAAIAEEIQRGVVPKKLLDLPGYQIGVSMSPARGVCSDYYDLIKIRGDRALIAFGDVAGKGVSAGLVMVMVRSILHLIVNSTKDAATLLGWVNRGVSGKVDMDHFTTLGLLLVDCPTGEFEYANAAHQPILLYRKESDSIETVDIKSIPIGVERTTEYSSRRFRLKGGDVLVMYSDGVVEAMNEQGRQFGRKNLGNALLRARTLGAREIAEAIRSDIDEFSGRSRRHDDQTVLVLKAQTR